MKVKTYVRAYVIFRFQNNCYDKSSAEYFNITKIAMISKYSLLQRELLITTLYLSIWTTNYALEQHHPFVILSP